jgi:hypothetical protein
MICRAMDKVLLPFYYNLGTYLGRLALFPITPPPNSTPDEQFLLWNLGNEAYKFLNSLYGQGRPLKVAQVVYDFNQALIDYGKTIGLGPDAMPNPGISVESARSQLIIRGMNLQAVVLADLQRMPVYAVPKQGAYDTDDLIDGADAVLPQEVKAKLSFMALREVRESGRCLAFGVPTASGFHMMRAVEDVLRDYCSAVPEMYGTKGQKIGLPTDRVPSWGDYTAYLEHCKEPDVEETRALLIAVKRNERDVIAHPDKVLTPNEAYTLFQKGQAAITSMAARLSIRPPALPPAAPRPPPYA